MSIHKTTYDLLKSRFGDRLLDVSDPPFNAAGNGGHDDTNALLLAIDHFEASGKSGAIYMPAGTLKITSQLTLASDHTRLIGSGPDRTFIRQYGAGVGIKLTAHRNCALIDFRMDADSPTTNLITHAISSEYSDSTTNYTGFMHEFRDLHIVGYTGGCGLRYTNNEMCIAERIDIYGCGTGVYADNSNHPTSALGHSNRWILVRAANCTGDGWEINSQNMCKIHGQALQNSGSQQMWIRGACKGLDIYVDAEHTNNTTIGLNVAGTKHHIRGDFVKLAQAIKCSSLTKSMIGACTFSNNSAGLLFDASSTGNKYLDFGDSVVDNGTPANTAL